MIRRTGEYTIQIINEEAKELFRIDDNHTLLTRVPLDYGVQLQSFGSHSGSGCLRGSLEQSFVIEVIDAFLPIVYTEDPVMVGAKALGGCRAGNGRGGRYRCVRAGIPGQFLCRGKIGRYRNHSGDIRQGARCLHPTGQWFATQQKILCPGLCHQCGGNGLWIEPEGSNRWLMSWHPVGPMRKRQTLEGLVEQSMVWNVSSAG